MHGVGHDDAAAEIDTAHPERTVNYFEGSCCADLPATALSVLRGAERSSEANGAF
jgi:hypothetical protein